MSSMLWYIFTNSCQYYDGDGDGDDDDAAGGTKEQIGGDVMMVGPGSDSTLN